MFSRTEQGRLGDPSSVGSVLLARLSRLLDSVLRLSYLDVDSPLKPVHMGLFPQQTVVSVSPPSSQWGDGSQLHVTGRHGPQSDCHAGKTAFLPQRPAPLQQQTPHLGRWYLWGWELQRTSAETPGSVHTGTGRARSSLGLNFPFPQRLTKLASPEV